MDELSNKDVEEADAPAPESAVETKLRPLIHIGYHKTASTWMQWHIFRRTELGLQRIAYDKPLHCLNPLHFDAAAYKAHYANALAECEAGKVPVMSSERLSGHPHSGGIDSRNIADFLKILFPDARILIVVREQRSAILSTYKQYVKKGGMCGIKGYLNPRPDGHVPLFHLDHFRYDALIAYYRDLFGADSVKVLTYEDFREAPHDFITEIADFGGFSKEGKFPLIWKMNRSAPALKVALKAKVNPLIRRDTVNGCSPFASRVGAFILLPILNVLGYLATPLINNAIDRRWERIVNAHVGDYYDQSNRRLAELVGKDLAAKGYHSGAG